MKLQTAFKLSALAVALASTSVMASTLDTSELGNDVWTDPRGPEVGNIDQSEYQYVDVGTGVVTSNTELTITANDLTSWYTVAGNEVIKIETLGPNGKVYTFYDGTGLDPELIQDERQHLGALVELTSGIELPTIDSAILNGETLDLQTYLEILTVPETELKLKYSDELIKAVKDDYLMTQGSDKLSGGLVPPNLGGVTRSTDYTLNEVALIKRLDSTYLEYAEKDTTHKYIGEKEGNLTDPDTSNPEVWLTIKADSDTRITTEYDRGVINGIINTDKKGHLDDANKYVQHFTNLFDENETVTDNVYGLVASEVKTVTTEDRTGTTTTDTLIDRYTSVTQAGVVVADNIGGTHTLITSEGITTGQLTVGGVDVGAALGNAAALGSLSEEQLDSIINGGEKIAANTAAIGELNGRVDAVETAVTDLDVKVTEEVSRLDGRIDTELAANAQASTTYTDQTATTLRQEAAAETTRVNTAIADGDTATLNAAKTHADEGDVATLAAANTYTDNQVAAFGSRVNQLNSRIDDVEKTAYRGIAIALAAQQQIPNIAAGQMAVFGGVGHYEGESAAALGLASVFADGRTSVSAALGVAGGGDIGGRVGVAYVFGGK